MIAAPSHLFHAVAAVLGALLCSAAGQAQTATAEHKTTAGPMALYLDPSAPTEERVRDLVSRMTPEEKTSQLVSVAPAIPRLHVPAYNYWTEGLHGNRDGWRRYGVSAGDRGCRELEHRIGPWHGRDHQHGRPRALPRSAAA